MLDANEAELAFRQSHDGVPPVGILKAVAELHGSGSAFKKESAAIIERKCATLWNRRSSGIFGNNLGDLSTSPDVTKQSLQFRCVKLYLL